MYKKALGSLICVYLALFGGMLCLMGTAQAKDTGAGDSFILGQVEQMGVAEYSSSGRRVVDYFLLSNPLSDTTEILQTSASLDNQEPALAGEAFPETLDTQGFSQSDIEVLQRIVEAEAGGEDADGRLLVANVVLNRVKDEMFPDNIPDVVFQKDNGVTQFSPVSNGSYYRVTVSEETAAAVERALAGEDISDGALYFVARKYADPKNLKWFDENLTFLFQHGGHEFFR